MLRAIGMPRGQVLGQVVIESTLVMAAGVVIGLLLGYGLYLWMSDGLNLADYAEGMEMAGLSSVLTPEFRVADFALVACLSLVFGMLASVYPAWRALRIKPLDALNSA